MARTRKIAPEVPIILDMKVGDVRGTNVQYATMAFDELGADAVTVSPYVGGYDSLTPFFARKEKGVIVVCRTSNPDAGTLQDLFVDISTQESSYLKQVDVRHRNGTHGRAQAKLFHHVAYLVSHQWNVPYGNACIVAAATCLGDVSAVRKIVGVTKGYEAEAGSIRGDFAMSGSQNLIHASDEPGNAEKEIGLIFTLEEMFEYENAEECLIYSDFERGK